MKPLIYPQVNINGTSRRELVDQLKEAHHALTIARHAMARAVPHPRDFQFRPDEYFPAREAWIDRVISVEELCNEIAQHALAIQDEGQK